MEERSILGVASQTQARGRVCVCAYVCVRVRGRVGGWVDMCVSRVFVCVRDDLQDAII